MATRVRAHRRRGTNGVKTHVRRNKKQYELTTNFNQLDMPYQVFAHNRADAMKLIKRKLRKGEYVVSLEEVKW